MPRKRIQKNRDIGIYNIPLDIILYQIPLFFLDFNDYINWFVTCKKFYNSRLHKICLSPIIDIPAVIRYVNTGFRNIYYSGKYYYIVNISFRYSSYRPTLILKNKSRFITVDTFYYTPVNTYGRLPHDIRIITGSKTSFNPKSRNLTTNRTIS